MSDATKQQFTEDNKLTHDSFLIECFIESLDPPPSHTGTNAEWVQHLFPSPETS